MWPIEWHHYRWHTYLKGHCCCVHFHWRISMLCPKMSWFCFQ